MYAVNSQSKLAKSMRYAGVTSGTFLNVSPDILSVSAGVDARRRMLAGGAREIRGAAIDCTELRFGPEHGMSIWHK